MNISAMIISDIQSDILTAEINKALYERTNFNMRVETLDFIDFHVIGRIESLIQKENLNEELGLLRTRAINLMIELKKIDSDLFQQLRQQIRIVNDKGLLLKEIIFKYLGTDITAIEQSHKVGYDNLDIFINELFSIQIIPEPTKDKEPEMVFYQKTPARIIFEMLGVAKIKPDDVFFDVGSGLGQVVILVNMITGVSANGIEYEPAYCEYAKQSASELNLSNVSFINEDARNMDYSEGTVFFLYTPFEGKMLQEVMRLLQKVAQKKGIRVFTYGPCSILIAQLNWLSCLTEKPDNFNRLYEFRSVIHENI